MDLVCPVENFSYIIFADSLYVNAKQIYMSPLYYDRVSHHRKISTTAHWNKSRTENIHFLFCLQGEALLKLGDSNQRPEIVHFTKVSLTQMGCPLYAVSFCIGTRTFFAQTIFSSAWVRFWKNNIFWSWNPFSLNHTKLSNIQFSCFKKSCKSSRLLKSVSKHFLYAVILLNFRPTKNKSSNWRWKMNTYLYWKPSHKMLESCSTLQV